MIRVPATGPVPARYMLIGEAPGADEESHKNPVTKQPEPMPFVGRSGSILDGVLRRVGLPREAAYITNVCKYRPPANKIEKWLTDNKAEAERNGLTHFSDGRWYNDLVKEGLEELPFEIERVQPEIIIPMGNAALWALTGEWGIMRWRGSELWYGPHRMVPTVHPAAILREMHLRRYFKHDLAVRVMAKMDTPGDGQEPSWQFQTGANEVTLQVLRAYRWILDHDTDPSGKIPIACDVETRRGRIDCVGLGCSNGDAVCIPFTNAAGEELWGDNCADILTELREILTHPNINLIGQNFIYDAQYFERDPRFGYRVLCGHDCKIAEHCLLPGTDKDLVTLSSLYCDWHCFWKDDLKEANENMDDEKRWRYNCRDCVVTYEVAMKQIRSLRKVGYL